MTAENNDSPPLGGFFFFTAPVVYRLHGTSGLPFSVYPQKQQNKIRAINAELSAS